MNFSPSSWSPGGFPWLTRGSGYNFATLRSWHLESPPSLDTVWSLIHTMFPPSAKSSQLQLLINFLPVTRGAQARRGGRCWGGLVHTCFQLPGKFGGQKPRPMLVPRITSAEPGLWRCGSRSARCKDVWAGVLEKTQTPACRAVCTS